MHSILEGASRKEIDNLKTKVEDMLGMAPESRPKAMQKKIAEDIVMEAIMSSGQQRRNDIYKACTFVWEITPNP